MKILLEALYARKKRGEWILCKLCCKQHWSNFNCMKDVKPEDLIP